MYDAQKVIDGYPLAFPGAPAAPGLSKVMDCVNADTDLADEPFALQKAAYMLATFKWETAHTFNPVEEIGKGRRHPYGQPDANGHTYYGRGLVQLTWLKNYESMGQALGIDLVNQPELACDPDIAYKIASLGMREGRFTGASLHKYLNANTIHTESAYVSCRRVINGFDHAEDIAGYAVTFEKLLTNAVIA